VVDLKGRLAELTGLIAERLAAVQADHLDRTLPAELVGGIVARAVTEVRNRPDVPDAGTATGPTPDGITAEAWRRHVAAGREAITQQRAVQLGIGITTEEILACRRYAISGDPRAMDGW